MGEVVNFRGKECIVIPMTNIEDWEVTQTSTGRYLATKKSLGCSFEFTFARGAPEHTDSKIIVSMSHTMFARVKNEALSAITKFLNETT